jgi:hypothetical protein
MILLFTNCWDDRPLMSLWKKKMNEMLIDKLTLMLESERNTGDEKLEGRIEVH